MPNSLRWRTVPAMSDPMTPERLAQIRACPPPPFNDMATQIVYGTIQELLAEVDRLNEHLQVSFGTSETLAEYADHLQAERDRLRAVAVEMHAAFRQDVHPGHRAKQSGMVPMETIDRWHKAIWPPIPGVLDWREPWSA